MDFNSNLTDLKLLENDLKDKWAHAKRLWRHQNFNFFFLPKPKYFVLHDLIDRRASHSARGAVVGLGHLQFLVVFWREASVQL